MEFSEYYHKKLDEEMAMQRSEAEKSYAASQETAYGSAIDSVVAAYIRRNNNDLKEGLKALATDLGEAIFKYATSEVYVPEDIFKSKDEMTKYVNIVTQKIKQGANGTLVDLLRHAAVDIINTRNTISM